MLGMSLGMIVEGSVSVLLAVTIGYCAVLNGRLKRLHSDRETLAKMVTDLVQATTLANAAVMELKTAALEAETKLNERLEEAYTLEDKLAGQVSNGSQLVEKIVRITAAAKSQQVPAAVPEQKPKPVAQPIEPQSRLHAALQQLAMRPGIGGRAA
jgi:hypothetical protein